MSLKFPSIEIVLSQGGSVEVGNVSDNKVFSLVRDSLIVNRQLTPVNPTRTGI
jgi:hypothetical protein